MFLTKIDLNHRNRQVLKDVSFPYEMHRTVMRGFLGVSAFGRVLWRLHRLEEAPPVLFVQSEAPPVSENWDSRYGRAESKADCRTFREGQVLHFSLYANVCKQNSVSHKRCPLFLPMDQQKWLLNKATSGGFEVSNVNSSEIGNVHCGIKGEARITAFGVRFDGLLRVTDVDAFAEVRKGGIGPAKGFGFGLLLVR